MHVCWHRDSSTLQADSNPENAGHEFSSTAPIAVLRNASPSTCPRVVATSSGHDELLRAAGG
jgi:hypothetical protein